METTNGFILTINIQDEDWMLTDPNDLERGWSRLTVHFSSRDAINRYFISGLETSSNRYINEIAYELRMKTFGENIIAITPERATKIRNRQHIFINKVSNLELNSTYELCDTIYFVLLPMRIYN
jgi:hypothetical protein